MKALISPNETCQTGYRVAEVEPDKDVFEVAPPLFWVECDNDVVADRFWYDSEDNTIKPVPVPAPVPELELEPEAGIE